jgi:hypothetical protein
MMHFAIHQADRIPSFFIPFFLTLSLFFATGLAFPAAIGD